METEDDALCNENYRVHLPLRGLRSALTIIVKIPLLVLGKDMLTQALFVCSALDIAFDMPYMQVKIKFTIKIKK
jgi:hypothetical protein